MKSCVFLVILALCQFLGPLYAGPADAGAAGNVPLLATFSHDLEQLTRQVAPSVVQIFTSGYGLASTGPSIMSRQLGTASGVIIDPNGYIVTNAHVVAGARKVEVLLAGSEDGDEDHPSILQPRGTRIPARVVGVDTPTDLALIKIETGGLPVLQFGDSDQLRQGQVVLAVGSPLGLGNTVTMGVVSAVSRQLHPDDPMVYVQTDAPINPGNSGGPLVDTAGQVIGINTMILSQSGGSEGVGLAIPSSTARDIIAQLRKAGHVHRGVIGVQLQSLNADMVAALGLPVAWGVIVADIQPDGPADKAGLEVGDVIVSVDGKPVDNVRHFGLNLYRHAADATVTLVVLRGAEKQTFVVPVMERPDDPYRFLDMVNPQQNLVPQLGILGIDIDAGLAAVLPTPRIAGGVLVAAIAPEANQSEQAFAAGDVIHSLNRTPVQSLAELRSVMDGLKPGAPVVVQVERQGMLLFVTLELN
jgi:serine protease Do